jgi:hypothetical protein
MLLYIGALEHVREKGTINYTFAPDIDGARFWPTVRIAEGIRDQIVWSGGITLTSPLGKRGHSTDFRVEPRRQGGFVISCEFDSVTASRGYDFSLSKNEPTVSD